MQYILCTLGIFFLSINTYAWENHQIIMPWVLKGLKPELKIKLYSMNIKSQIQVPTFLHEIVKNKPHEVGRGLASNTLQLSLVTQFQAYPVKNAFELFLSPAVDEPDHGMDRDLDDTADPKQERIYMGKKTGPTSQGFRHMYFGGWTITKPIATFQIPIRSLGQAPDRAELFAKEALQLLKEKNEYWGFRMLNWALHYTQDLSQPYHAAQAPSISMGAWSELLTWNLPTGFENLIKVSTRIISNYHYAYEDFVKLQILEGEKSRFRDCLTNPKNFALLSTEHFQHTEDLSPKELALEVAKRSIELAPEIGKYSIEFFGTELRQPSFDLPNRKGIVDYGYILLDPKKENARQKLEKATCQALANGVLASQILIEWTLRQI
ncbi:MAG: hypothetical protein HY843_01610 [Bdellovibrio sp.]|nr:hypothetical protein [Bdellovibrio sp.]